MSLLLVRSASLGTIGLGAYLLRWLAGPTGWAARLALHFEQRAGRTVLVHRSPEGSLAVQKPFYPEGDVCHVYLLHPPGGVVGGDRLVIAIEVASDAHAVITTPAAGKFYRAAGPASMQEQRLSVEAVESDDLFSATLLDPVLLCRYLGDSAESARRCFTDAWGAVRPALLGLDAQPPRI